jgi:hypothetical protein
MGSGHPQGRRPAKQAFVEDRHPSNKPSGAVSKEGRLGQPGISIDLWSLGVRGNGAMRLAGPLLLLQR